MDKETIFLIVLLAVMVIASTLLIIQVHKLHFEFIQLTEKQQEALEEVHRNAKNIQKDIERLQKRKGYTQKIQKQKIKQMHYQLLNS